MKNKYNTVDEITAAFIGKGWAPDTTFEEVTLDDAEQHGFGHIASKIRRGRRFYRMGVTGNIFDGNGKIAMFNIRFHAVSEAEAREDAAREEEIRKANDEARKQRRIRAANAICPDTASEDNGPETI